MTIKEINRDIPKHLKPLIEEGQLESVLRLEMFNVPEIEMQHAKRGVRAVFETCKAGFPDRYVDPTEEFYGAGVVDSDSHLIYLFPCVTQRDRERLSLALEGVLRRNDVKHQIGKM